MSKLVKNREVAFHAIGDAWTDGVDPGEFTFHHEGVPYLRVSKVGDGECFTIGNKAHLRKLAFAILDFTGGRR